MMSANDYDNSADPASLRGQQTSKYDDVADDGSNAYQSTASQSSLLKRNRASRSAGARSVEFRTQHSEISDQVDGETDVHHYEDEYSPRQPYYVRTVKEYNKLLEPRAQRRLQFQQDEEVAFTRANDEFLQHARSPTNEEMARRARQR